MQLHFSGSGARPLYESCFAKSRWCEADKKRAQLQPAPAGPHPSCSKHPIAGCLWLCHHVQEHREPCVPLTMGFRSGGLMFLFCQPLLEKNHQCIQNFLPTKVLLPKEDKLILFCFHRFSQCTSVELTDI